MPSDLQVSNIRDQANANSAITIGSDGQITVNQNNPTITLGSNATFDSGMPIQIYRFGFDSNVDHSSSSTFANAGTFTITNKRANSKFYIQASCIMFSEGNAVGNQAQVGINTSADGSGTWVSWNSGTKGMAKLIVENVSELETGTVVGYVADTGSVSLRSYYLIFKPSVNSRNINLSTTYGLIIEYM